MKKMFGKVRMWNADRGYGFITRDDRGGADVFVHVSNLQRGIYHLEASDRVEFDIGTNSRTGEPCAIDVELVPAPAR